jgi:hypothetical protein
MMIMLKLIHTLVWALFAGRIVALPLWVASYNKQTFGSLYVAGIFYTLVQWNGTRG